MNAGRINLRSGQQSLRVGGERVSQAGNVELAAPRRLLGDDDSRLGLKWPLPVAVISDKDQKFASFDAVEPELKRRMAMTA